MGYIWKALEEGVSEMYGPGGLPEPYVSENRSLPLTGWVFLPFLVRFHTNCTAPLPPLAGFGGGLEQKIMFRKVGTIGEVYEGKIVKKWGRTSLLVGS